jgi:hypothetical protein
MGNHIISKGERADDCRRQNRNKMFISLSGTVITMALIRRWWDRQKITPWSKFAVTFHGFAVQSNMMHTK